MKSVEQRDADRIGFLLAAFELTGGRRGVRVTLEEVIERAGIHLEDAHESHEIKQWLSERGLTEAETLDGSFGLSGKGIDAGERMYREAAKTSAAAPSRTPPPTAQPAPTAVFQLEVSPDERAAIERFIGDYVDAKLNGTLGIEGRDLAEAEAQVATIQAQMQSPKPRSWIVRIATKALVEIGTNAGGNGVWAGVNYLAQKVLTGL